MGDKHIPYRNSKVGKLLVNELFVLLTTNLSSSRTYCKIVLAGTLKHSYVVFAHERIGTPLTVFFFADVRQCVALGF